MALDYKQAAVKLGMTVILLKWFSRYSPKSDGRKLQVSDEGFIEEAELEAFDKHLWSEWPTRSVPAEISRELQREAQGTCPICNRGTDVPQEAHIDRKGKEIAHYAQHPHNLILLCRECHGRYDDLPGSTITNDVVRTAKKRVLSRLLEDVARDVATAHAVTKQIEETREAVRGVISRIGSTVQVPTNAALDEDLLNRVAQAVLEAAGIHLDAEPVSTPEALSETLQQIGAAMTYTRPATAGVLRSYAAHLDAAKEDLADEWDHVPVDERAKCIRCGSPALISELECVRCSQTNWTLSDSESYRIDEKGQVYESDDDDRYPSRPIRCDHCKGTLFTVHFKSLCGWCDHMSERARDDD
jgi:hypothetical protein